MKFLRRLVTTLTVIMVGGVLVVIALLVIRLSDGKGDTAASLPLPDQIALPEGAVARAVTFGPDWIAVVTTDNRILILNSSDGRIRQSLQID